MSIQQSALNILRLHLYIFFGVRLKYFNLLDDLQANNNKNKLKDMCEVLC